MNPTNKLTKRREELKSQIVKVMQKNYLEMFDILNELFELEKAINPDYTMMQLAIDNELSTTYVYHVMNWKEVNPNVKKLVEKGKISFSKAIRVCYRIAEPKQEEVINQVIEKKLTRTQIEKYISKQGIKLKQFTEEKEYSDNWNINRDINKYCFKLQRTLQSVAKIPKNQKPVVKHNLLKLKESIEIGLRVLE